MDNILTRPIVLLLTALIDGNFRVTGNSHISLLPGMKGSVDAAKIQAWSRMTNQSKERLVMSFKGR